MKRCTKCSESKPLTEFYSSGSNVVCCKVCHHAYGAVYRLERKAALQRSKAQYYKANKLALSAKFSSYRMRHRAAIRVKALRYYYANKSSRMSKVKMRRQCEPVFSIRERCRGRIASALRNQGSTKSTRTNELLGCAPKELMEHIQKQFKPGMNWNNRHLWHIDHIRPCVSFDLFDPEQQRQCFHFSNLQPLWAHENMFKGSTWITNAGNADNLCKTNNIKEKVWDKQ